MNLPNKITILRILLIPVFIAILYIPIKYQNIIAAVVFLLIALTDKLDGYLARKFNQVTDLGKLMDPLADKMLISAGMIFLIGRNPVGIPAWIAFLTILREFVITGLRSIDKEKLILSASWFGKLKMFFQVLGIILVLLNLKFSYYILIASVIFSWWSCIDYIIKGKKILKKVSF